MFIASLLSTSLILLWYVLPKLESQITNNDTYFAIVIQICVGGY